MFLKHLKLRPPSGDVNKDKLPRGAMQLTNKERARQTARPDRNKIITFRKQVDRQIDEQTAKKVVLPDIII